MGQPTHRTYVDKHYCFQEVLWYRPKGNNIRTRNMKYTPTLWTHRHACFLDGSINRIHIRGKHFVILLSINLLASFCVQCCSMPPYRSVAYHIYISIMFSCPFHFRSSWSWNLVSICILSLENSCHYGIKSVVSMLYSL